MLLFPFNDHIIPGGCGLGDQSGTATNASVSGADPIRFVLRLVVYVVRESFDRKLRFSSMCEGSFQGR